MIPRETIDKLKSNWGDKAAAFDVCAYIRFYCPYSKCDWYIYAINPDDENVAMMMTGENPPSHVEIELDELYGMYDAQTGEDLPIDNQFIPRPLKCIIEELREKAHAWERD